MKLRTGAAIGAAAYYKLLGAIHGGVQLPHPGDARIIGGNAKRDRLLRLAHTKESTDGTRQDSPTDTLELQERPEAAG